MKKLTVLSFIPLLSLFISSLAHGIGGNPSDTWYYVSISGVEGVTGSETAFISLGEAEAFMRETVPYGNNLVLRDTSGTEPNVTYYYHFEDEEILPGTAWGYRDYYHSGIHGSEQGAVDQFLMESNYQCIEENGPMGTWNVGSVWYCYPQYNGYTAPYTREIATYNLDINTSAQCDGGTINVDPVFCRIRQDSCPDHTPTLYSGQCTSNVTATIYQYKCDCNETGITGACVAVPTDTLNYLDAMGTFHSTIVAQDSQYNPLSCQEKIEIPRKCPKDSPESPFKGNPINITNGAKTQTETDFIGDGEDPLKIVRHYNTTPITQGLELPKPFEEEKFTAFEGDETLCSGGIYSETTSAGSRSSNNREWRIEAPSACPILILYKPSGEKIVYMKMTNPPGAGLWYASNDPKDGQIQYYARWYNYYDGSGKRYEFKYGKPVYIRQGGKLSRFIYSGNLLTSYINAYGRTLNYYYDDQDRNISIRTPSGDYYKYAYDNNDNIIEAIFPDDTLSDDSDNPRKQYLFEDSRFPNALTGIIDESGTRYATWTYDQYGRAIASEHDSGIDKTEIEYIDGYSSRVKEYQNDTQFKETVYRYERIRGKNQITSVEPSLCQDCTIGNAQYSFEFETGNLLQKIDENGIVTSYEYDVDNNEIKRTHAVGTAEEYIVETVWHSSLNKPLVVTEPGKTTEYTYDTEGMMLTKKVTDTVTLEFSETNYTYNSKKALVSIDGPRTDISDTTTYAYNTSGYKLSETNALGHVTAFAYHDANGRPGKITDQNGVITYLTYNKKGRLITSTRNGQSTQLTYDAVGNLTQTAAPDGTVLKYEYDAANRLIAIEDDAGNRTEYILDAMGNQIEVNLNDPTGTLKNKKQQVYNLLGRLTQSLNAQNHVTSHVYDAKGNLTQTTDANLNPTAQSYDALDRLQQTTDALNGTTSYTYDAQGNLISVTDPNGLTTSYSYDYLGNHISQTSPDTGATTYTYDEAGNRLTKTDARGITATYSYDALNRLTQISYPNSSLNVSYSYDQGTYGIGRLTSMSDANGTTSYTYNAFGQPLSKSRTSSDAITTVFSYVYDNTGRLTSQTYPSGRTLNYSYDAHGELSSLSVIPPGGTTQNLAQNIQRLPFGPIQTFDYGNGLSLNRIFDLDYQLTQQTISGILQSNYLHDPVGNVTDWQDLLDTSRDQQFGYDQLDRLASASGVYGSLSYGYDATGNRLSLNDGTTTETYSYVPNSHRLQQILGSVTDDRTYDVAGNTIQSLIGSYTYDDTNRMVGFSKTGTQANYAYNGKGERIRKAVNGAITRYRYGANAQLMGEYDVNGSAIREYVYLSSQPLVQLSKDPTTQAETVHYLHTDHLGAVVKASDSTQTLVWDALRKPFGERNITTAQISMPLGFPGQIYDEETGSYYNYFRDYDPTTGRYLQSDPIGLEGGINTYTYVRNNPIKYIDPEGKAPLCPPGQRGVPLAGYESEFPKYWDCKPYPPNDYNPTTEKDKCILDCMLKNSAMCTSIAMGTAGLGFTAGAVASIPGGGSFGPIGGKIGGTLGGMACAEALKMDCKEECKKKDQCN